LQKKFAKALLCGIIGYEVGLMDVKAIRGAVCAQNTVGSIEENTTRLLKEIFAANSLAIDDVIAVTFTCTKDLDAAYPAVAARKFGLTHASLMCVQEMDVVGSLPQCIRVQILASTTIAQNKISHIYLGEAKRLRSDLNPKAKGVIQIAIDGPSGSGKSTIAKMLSEKTGIIYVDTGALYRAAGLFAVRMGAGLDSEAAINSIAKNMRIEIDYIDGAQRTFLNGEDVTKAIRADKVGLAASAVGRFEYVRERVVSLIRDVASRQSVVMDGRDIATIVLPNANVKIFLTASVEVRARRRCDELAAYLGEAVDFDTIFAQIEQRDFQDMTREISPLVKVEDAHEIDATNLTKEQVVDKILAIDAIAQFLG